MVECGAELSDLPRFGIPESQTVAGARKGTLKLQSLPGCAVSPVAPPKKAHMGVNSTPSSRIWLLEPNDVPKSCTSLRQFDRTPLGGETFCLSDRHSKLDLIMKRVPL